MSLAKSYLLVKQRIQSCLSKHRISSNVDLLAVSKKHSISKIQQLYELGHRKFGESYVNEAVVKIEEFSSLNIEWHFIGPVQSNKTKLIAKYFSWIQSVDSLKLLKRLNQQRANGKDKLNVLLQLNVSGENSKRGLNANGLLQLAKECEQFDNLRIRGLMCIPAPTSDKIMQRKQFDECYDVFEELNTIIPVDTLSMGMSSDLESAILSGTTMVRIGTDIFGPRV